MNTALLVIDVQHALFDMEPPPFERDEVIGRINGLTNRAREAGVPVFIIQHESASATLTRGSSGWELANGLQSAASDVLVGKKTPDSFLRTDLHQQLQSRDIKRVVLCGYASEFCVDTTCRSAAAHGYSVCIAADAHTTHDKPHSPAAAIRIHENNTLPNITSFGVPIVALPSEQISFAA